MATAVQTKTRSAINRGVLLRRPEGGRGCRDHCVYRSNVLFVVRFVLIIVKVVPFVGLLVLFFIIIVVGDDIDLDGMDLNHFHFGFALETGQNFAFLDFIFVDVDFSTAFRTPDHGEILLENG